MDEGTPQPESTQTPAEPTPLVLELFEGTAADVLARRTPLSSYRLQLHAGFNFRRAQDVLGYLGKLGAGAIYSSPVLEAMPGSMHGYDVVNHNRVNPELGTAVDYAAFCEAVRGQGMQYVLDSVPNHMGIEKGNALWEDVLENGPASRYARFFDVDWAPVKTELREKVLLPVLGDQYGVVLERGELKLEYGDGAFVLRYFDHVYPIGPRGYREVLQHDLVTLEKELGAEDETFLELQSILTAIEHLPTRHERDSARVLERNREKQVIKRRLDTLVQKSLKVAEHLKRNLVVFNGTPGEPRSFDRFDELLQHYASYRLADWRVAGEEINYRRFFDINGLAAIRVEDREVFNEAHALPFKFLAQGFITGLRIDHPDGLFDPTAYFLDLQQGFFVELARHRYLTGGGKEEEWPSLEGALAKLWLEDVARPGSKLRKGLYVVGEKIQGGRERIPDSWAIHGTTGYRFANALSGIFVDRRNERALSVAYEKFIEHRLDFEELVYEKKRLIMSISMSSEVAVLARELNRISEMNRRSRDFTFNVLRRALVEFVAHFPVYRTYLDGRETIDARDVQYIEWTIARAKERDLNTNGSVFDFLGDVLLARYPEQLPEADRAVWLRFAMKLQQLSGPVMAKGLEDTVFYIYNRLTSLNEVGGEPEHFGTSVQTFHLRNQERSEGWPAALLTSSTHDTKRSEDVRARINVLSELPDEWRKSLRRFERLNRKHKGTAAGRPAPSSNDEYLFYQTVLGTLPMGAARTPLADETWAELTRRVRDYMQKAIKEAKTHTSWTKPDAAYEQAVTDFVERSLDRRGNGVFVGALLELFERLEWPGQLNALGQVLLKLASPGVPDIYQGCELWDLSLVDPDNRRPVDYALREKLLEQMDARTVADRASLARELSADLTDGRAKLYLTAEALRLRQRKPELFRGGGYAALELVGERAEHAVAFWRMHGDGEGVVAVAPRLTASLGGKGPQVLAQALEHVTVVLPPAAAKLRWRNVLTGETLAPLVREDGHATFALGEQLKSFPVLLLET